MGESKGSATALLLLHAAVYAGLAWVYAPLPLVGVVLALLLIAISVVDIQRFEIPDLASALLIATGGVAVWHLAAPWEEHAIAALAFPALLYVVGVAYLRLRGQPGLGFGDVKLAAGLGLWLGPQGSVWALLAASLSGIVALLVIARLRGTDAEGLMASGVAFGPFLCLSAWAVWLQGNAL